MEDKKVSTKSCIFRYNQTKSYNLERNNRKTVWHDSNRIYMFLHLVTFFQLLITNKLTLAQPAIENLTDYGDVSSSMREESAKQLVDKKNLYYNTDKLINSMNEKRALNETEFLLDFSTQHSAHKTNKNIGFLEGKNNSQTNQTPSSGRAMDVVKKAVKKAAKKAKKAKKKLKKKIKHLAHKAKTKLHHAVHQASTG